MEPSAGASEGGAVVVENVVKRYGTVPALSNVSLQVHGGEFLALLGPSGSGKTTLLMAIAGFEPIHGGRILIDQLDVTSVAPSARNLGMVFQRYALFPHMNLRDNVGFPLRMRAVSRAQRETLANEVLTTVGLDGYGDRMPAQLSGGQQQRVALARAIVYKPPVLLMDEPLSALDKNLREQMRLEIKHLQKRLGVTVIFVTHDQEEALVMADRIAVMDKGQLVQVGTPRELYERPASEFVAGFLGETNYFDGLVTGRDGEVVHMKLRNEAQVSGVFCENALSGTRLRLSVRPESIEILQHQEASGAVPGRLAELIYAGPQTIALVDVGLPDPVTVRGPSVAPGSGPQQGAAVWLRWRPEDGRAFAAGS
ncbi:MAG: ABC transporter ATP-binding protein [Ramlibacter sp.]